MGNDRIPCCIPFCKRTGSRAKFPNCSEFMCGKHYQLGSRTLRRRRAKLRRRMLRTRGDTRDAQRLSALDWRLWDRIKAQAIERAAGI